MQFMLFAKIQKEIYGQELSLVALIIMQNKMLLSENIFLIIRKTLLAANAVREICKDKYGNLWIGTEDGGLNEINNATNKLIRVQTIR